MNDFEDALTALVVDDDVFDQTNFDPIEFLNKKFPNERSTTKNDTESIDTLLVHLQKEEEEVKQQLTNAMRDSFNDNNKHPTQLLTIHQDLENLNKELFGIEDRANKTHSLVEILSRDIKNLDRAKLNLTMTVTRLKRFVMLVQALEQLRTYAQDRKYKQVANLLLACNHLANDFTDLADKVPKVDELFDQKTQLLTYLRQQLLEDYNTVHLDKDRVSSNLEEANECVDAMSMREEVLTNFCLNILEDYKRMYGPPSDKSGLEFIENRFSWISNKLSEYRDRYHIYFPEEWKGQSCLCEHFCHITKQHIVEVLSATSGLPDLLCKMLRASIQFEDITSRRYDAPQIKCIISDCFDSFMGPWVIQEKNQLKAIFQNENDDKVLLGGKLDPDEDMSDDSTEPKNVFATAPNLFMQMQASFKRWQSFSKPSALKEMFQSFKDVLHLYSIVLENRIPSEHFSLNTGLSKEMAEIICTVFGTSDYVNSAMPKLQELFDDAAAKVIVDPPQNRLASNKRKGSKESFHTSRKGSVASNKSMSSRGSHSSNRELSMFSFDDTADLYGILMGKAVQGLIQHSEKLFLQLFEQLMEQEIAPEEEVGMSSSCEEICTQVRNLFSKVSVHLNPWHFNFFLDKFIDWFVPQYVKDIYQGSYTPRLAEQLLFDTQTFKSMLVNLPPQFTGAPVSRIYEGMVTKKIQQAELVFEVLCDKVPDDITEQQLVRITALRREEGAPTAKREDRNLASGSSNKMNASGSVNKMNVPAEDSLTASPEAFMKKNIFAGLQDMKGLQGNINKGLQDMKGFGDFKKNFFSLGKKKDKDNKDSGI